MQQHEIGNEATIFLIDDGDASINRDYGQPGQTRLQAQTDAVDSISQFIFRNHGESSVGVMTIGGHVRNQKGPSRKLDATLGILRTQINCTGSAKLLAGLKTAACALDNRGNTTQRPHVIAFICSDLLDDADDLIKRVKLLRKSGISVDLVSMNRLDAVAQEKLEAVSAATDAKHVAIVAGTAKIADVILREGVVEGVDLSRFGVVNDFDNDFDFGAEDDVDLQAAIQMSIQDAEAAAARQQEEATAARRQEEEATAPAPEGSSKDRKAGDRMDESS